MKPCSECPFNNEEEGTRYLFGSIGLNDRRARMYAMLGIKRLPCHMRVHQPCMGFKQYKQQHEDNIDIDPNRKCRRRPLAFSQATGKAV